MKKTFLIILLLIIPILGNRALNEAQILMMKEIINITKDIKLIHL